MDDRDIRFGEIIIHRTGDLSMRITIEETEIDFEEIGEGTPVIMLHGFPLDREVMKGCMEPIFCRRPGYRRIYLDMPGMGKSIPGDRVRNSDDMLDVIERFIEMRVSEDRYLLIGYSYGCYIGRGLVKHQAVKIMGAAFICPLIIAKDDLRNLLPRDEPDSPPIPFNELEDDLQILLTLSQKVNDRVIERYKKEIKTTLEIQSDFIQKFRRDSYAFSFDVDELEEPFQGPVLFLTGRQDRMVGFKDAWDILDNYPRATFAVLDGAGHYLQVDKEDLFEDLLNEFLDGFECP
jgi:pimeloyl-ACP methyl ester carboxylesterase